MAQANLCVKNLIKYNRTIEDINEDIIIIEYGSFEIYFAIVFSNIWNPGSNLWNTSIENTEEFKYDLSEATYKKSS